MPQLLFESPFPPEECRRRLEAATEPDRFRSDFTFRTAVLTRFTSDGFRLRLRRAFFRNSFSRLVYGRLRTTARGTMIEARVRLHPYVRAFTIVWFGFIGLWSALVIGLWIVERFSGERVFDSSPWPGVLMAPALIVFGVLFLRTGRADAHELLTFMQSVLEATPAQERAA